MKLYIRYNTHALAVETSDDTILKDTVWLKIDKMYQLLSLPGELVGESNQKAFKMLKYDIEDPETYSTPFSDKDYLINIRDAVEISTLKEFPDHPLITEKEIKEYEEKANKMLTENVNNRNDMKLSD